MKQPEFEFCMKQFKISVAVLTVLILAVLAWAAGTANMKHLNRRQLLTLAAATTPVTATRGPDILLNSRMIHGYRGNCNQCHVTRQVPPYVMARARQGIPISVTAPMPHGYRGNCNACHMVNGGFPPQPAQPVPALAGPAVPLPVSPAAPQPVTPAVPMPDAGKVAIASTGPGLNNPVAPDFATSPWFIFYDPATDQYRAIANPNAADIQGSSRQSSQFMVDQGAANVIAGSFSPQSAAAMTQLHLTLFPGASGTVGEVLALYRGGGMRPYQAGRGSPAPQYQQAPRAGTQGTLL